MHNSPIEKIRRAKVVILDFDGVIKESLDAKAEAFCSLFDTADPQALHEIREHHLRNGGISRQVKIPIYMQIAGLGVEQQSVEEKLDELSSIIVENVLNSNWVPGAREYLCTNPFNQNLYVASATPGKELELICKRSRIFEYFTEIYGSENSKKDSCRTILEREKCNPGDCVFIGDSLSDYLPAMELRVPFILRRHMHNNDLLERVGPSWIENFRSIMDRHSEVP